MDLKYKEPVKSQTYSIPVSAIIKLNELSENNLISKSEIITQLILQYYETAKNDKIVLCKTCGARYRCKKEKLLTTCEVCKSQIGG